jgi:hypothetical protein
VSEPEFSMGTSPPLSSTTTLVLALALMLMTSLRLAWKRGMDLSRSASGVG